MVSVVRFVVLGLVFVDLGRLDERAVKVVREAGVIRLLQPKTHGGHEAHPREFAETVMKIAALDGSTGWVAGVVGVHPWEMAMADRRVQDEVWGEDPDTWIASPYAPMGVLRPVDGGYVFNGRWQFSSGTDHCDWIFLGGRLGDAEGRPIMPPTHFHVILPRSSYELVDDSWDVVGLKGTGSKGIIVADAFVPDYRMLPFASVSDGSAAREAGLTSTLYHVPFSQTFPLGITAAVIGIAEGTLAHHLAYQKDRTQITGTKIKNKPHEHNADNETSTENTATHTTQNKNICRFYDQAEAGRPSTFEE